MERDGNKGKSKLTAVPCTRKQANTFVGAMHRHHKPVVSGKFCIAIVDEEGLVRGVAMIGNPVARSLMDGWTVEVNRVATDGCPNACSALYGASWRTAKAMGYRRMFTYTLASEPGASLRGAGWKQDSIVNGRSWHTPSRPRAVESHPTEDKIRWVVEVQSAVRHGDVQWPVSSEDEGDTVFDMFGGNNG
jgi:hypothetical protein